jgi:ComF family protein
MLSSSGRRSPLQLLMDVALAQDCTLCAGRSAGLVCAACEAALPRWTPCDDGVAAFAYRFPVDRLVQRFKSGGDLAIGRWLGERLAKAVRAEARPDLLVAPPLSRQRLRARGFNQSVELARTVAGALHLRRAVRGLRKVRETPPQQGLGRRARLRNLQGAFRCTLALRGLHVAIVDDVVTTGATTQALAAVLKRAGARRVSVWSIARAPRRGR